MKGDFSRDTFNLKKNFSRVLMQQGRVQLDADWNEQSAILLHYLRTLAKDLIGPHAGSGDSFTIRFSEDKKDLIISAGHYYVDGILCENEIDVSYFNQPHYPMDKKDDFPFPFLAYLDVWERHVTCFEDESLREVALGGIDTTTRAQVVWQVKLRGGLSVKEVDAGCDNIRFPIKSDALLLARTLPAQPSDDPCNIEPDARYRGAENQLYRVEIHTGNVDENGDLLNDEKPNEKPTFKWSRENGSVAFSVISITKSSDATEVRLASLGRDDNSGLREGDWVELVDDAYTLQNRADNLLQIVSIDRDEMSVSLNGTTTISADRNSGNHSLLRRWDQKAGNAPEGGLTLGDDKAAVIMEGSGNDNWLKLEDGIQIQFQRTSGNTAQMSRYRTGDYWLIPARTATGDVEWTKSASGELIPQSPHGIEHHYAPLGIAADKDSPPKHCRCTLQSITECPPVREQRSKVKKT